MTAVEMAAFAREKEKIVRNVMAAAERVLLDECGGNPEVMLQLTAEVSKEFVFKLQKMTETEIWKKKMLCEVEPEILNLGKLCKQEKMIETPWVVFYQILGC